MKRLLESLRNKKTKQTHNPRTKQTNKTPTKQNKKTGGKKKRGYIVSFVFVLGHYFRPDCRLKQLVGVSASSYFLYWKINSACLLCCPE